MLRQLLSMLFFLDFCAAVADPLPNVFLQAKLMMKDCQVGALIFGDVENSVSFKSQGLTAHPATIFINDTPVLATAYLSSGSFINFRIFSNLIQLMIQESNNLVVGHEYKIRIFNKKLREYSQDQEIDFQIDLLRSKQFLFQYSQQSLK